ncbi:MAG: hypothetical protein KAH57_09660, partial [Thermoplasmata archaeon]|nr:hypothetical protein [Thermoplasmata archaeon]
MYEKRTAEEENRWKYGMVNGLLHVEEFKMMDVKICETCYFPYGEMVDGGTMNSFHQRCSCPSNGPDEERWPRHDYNEIIRICDCCGAEPLISGSRWSVWFCEKCKWEILNRNHEMGIFLVPIGRHSIMNMLMLSFEEAEERKKRVAFIKEVNGLFSRMDILL